MDARVSRRARSGSPWTPISPAGPDLQLDPRRARATAPGRRSAASGGSSLWLREPIDPAPVRRLARGGDEPPVDQRVDDRQQRRPARQRLRLRLERVPGEHEHPEPGRADPARQRGHPGDLRERLAPEERHALDAVADARRLDLRHQRVDGEHGPARRREQLGVAAARAAERAALDPQRVAAVRALGLAAGDPVGDPQRGWLWGQVTHRPLRRAPRPSGAGAGRRTRRGGRRRGAARLAGRGAA
jgi:hypothetical protein